jgi:nucleotide-binding universal stress UspA family protein
MKKILTFVGGGDRDATILQTALAAARPLAAQLDCLHARVPTAEAVRYAHTEFARGTALRNALDQLGADKEAFARLAKENVRSFCTEAGIELGTIPGKASGVSASFREEVSNDLALLTAQAAQSDLVVMGRARQKQGLAPDTLESLVRHSGRPVLAAVSVAPATVTDMILVAWKDAASSASAVGAAAPLLAKAQRVVFVSIAQPDAAKLDDLRQVAREMGGPNAEARIVAADPRGVPQSIAVVATVLGAQLVVMGAYGRSRTREILFGSCTDHVLQATDVPLLLMH